MAYVDSEIRQIDVSAFRKLMEQNTEFVKEIIDILSANSIQIYGRFFCLTYKQAFGRLADILLRVEVEYPVQGRGPPLSLLADDPA